MSVLTHRVVDSPIGILTSVWDVDRRALVGLYVREPDAADGSPAVAGGPLDRVVDELTEYFAGRRRRFDDLPLAPRGTPFQHAVWDALRDVPYGSTTTYGALASAVGRPGAARAVGSANACNPISLVVPCHRVLTAAGRPSGGGPGVRRKEWLQGLERTGIAGGGEVSTR